MGQQEGIKSDTKKNFSWELWMLNDQEVSP